MFFVSHSKLSWQINDWVTLLHENDYILLGCVSGFLLLLEKHPICFNIQGEEEQELPLFYHS